VDFNGIAVDDRGAADECVGAAEMLGSSSAAHASSWVAGLNVASLCYAAYTAHQSPSQSASARGNRRDPSLSRSQDPARARGFAQPKR
jgi:hypothetical protein